MRLQGLLECKYRAGCSSLKTEVSDYERSDWENASGHADS